MRSFILLLFLATLVDAVLLELPARGSRCVGEDMAEDAMGKFTFMVIHPGSRG